MAEREDDIQSWIDSSRVIALQGTAWRLETIAAEYRGEAAELSDYSSSGVEFMLDALYPEIRNLTTIALQDGCAGVPAIVLRDSGQVAWVMEEAAREIRRLRSQLLELADSSQPRPHALA